MTRAFHMLLDIFQKFPVISQNVSQKLFKKESKVAFCNESCSNVARKNKNFSWCSLPIFDLMLKYANFTTSLRFLSIFVQVKTTRQY